MHHPSMDKKESKKIIAENVFKKNIRQKLKI